MSSATEIRSLGPDEWRIFREVRLAALKEAPYAFGSRWEDEKDRPEDAWRAAVRSRTRFVVEVNSQVVGMVAVAPGNYSGTAYVTSLWVDPRSRGQSVGDLLVSTILDWVRAAGLTQILLWVTEDNSHAQHLYERHGFTRTGLSQPVRDGETRLECEMSRRL